MHWRNSLEEEGYHADAKYVREELISKIDSDLPIYNERGKKKLLGLIGWLTLNKTVDEFYSSKNFYEHKLEMLLSNMF